jgi:hypothetical protein
MIKIEVRNGEYVVYVPYEQRYRIKSIPGYRWDPQRKAWIFPEKPIYKQAIIAEFGDVKIPTSDTIDAFNVKLEPPLVLAQLATENEDVSLYLRDLWHTYLSTFGEYIKSEEAHKQTLEKMIAINQRAMSTTKILSDIVEVIEEAGLADVEDQDIAQVLRVTFQEKTQNADLVARIAVAEARLKTLLEENEKLKGTSFQKAEEDVLVALAQEVLGDEVSEAQQLKRFRLDESGALFLQTRLQHAIAVRLGNTDARAKFVDLINEADDARLISRDGKQFCHFVRVQRNLVAHEEVHESELRSRVALSLLAFALAIRELMRN